MAFAVADRVRETTTTTGTGTLNLDGAVSGFRTFVSGIGDGNVTYYAIVHRTSAEFEIGIGTVTDASTDTLSRTTVLSSSNSNSAVTFSAGTKDVFCTQPASKAVFEDNNADVTLPDDLILGSDSAVLKFGADSDTTLTHTDGTGLTLNSTNKLTFGDAASFVQQSSNGVLRIDGEATIDLNASTAVTVSNDLKLDSDSAVLGFGADGDITLTHTADTGLTLNGTFTATSVTANSGVVVDNITIDGTEIDLSSGDLTLDVAGDIILDANGANITFKDDGTSILDIANNSSDVELTVSVADKNFAIKGTDGSSAITALDIDMALAGKATFNGAITGGGLLTTGGNIVIPDAGNIGSASDTDAIAIASNGVVTFSQAPVFPDGSIALADLDIDGGTDIGADLVGDDLIIVDDNAGGTNRKATLTRLMTFVNANVSSSNPAADDIQAGDAAVNLTTTSGNITIDAQANDSDIIFKGTDGSSDTTFLTIDGSDAGKALFNAGATFSSNVSISTADNTDTLTLISTDADANAGPVLNLQRDSGSPADDDLVGSIRYSADNDAGEQTNLFQTNVFLADASDGSEDFQFEMDGMIAGTQRNFLTMSAGAIIFNEDAQDIDFRVESSGNANAFKVDAGNDKIVVDVSFDLNDNKRIRLGDGNDLQIYHSGSSSYIINDTGDLTLDLAADLVIDADGGDVEFQDGGTLVGHFAINTSDFKIISDVSDKDILFLGNDGGSQITAAQLDMSDAGAFICKGNVTAFGSPSDIRLKENIEVIPNALDKVSELRGVTFNYKKDGKKSTGLIAQELEKVLPEVVYDTHEIDNDDEQFKAVRYGNVVGLLVEAIKELKAEIEELKKG